MPDYRKLYYSSQAQLAEAIETLENSHGTAALRYMVSNGADTQSSRAHLRKAERFQAEW